MLLVKITNSDGSDPIILEQAKDRSYTKSVNSSDEGITFNIAKNSAKAEVLNPDTTGYKKFWEVWDTETNERLNYGPITAIEEDGTDWKVQGAGRSAILADFFKTKKTFYIPIDNLVDDLRYENVAGQPRTTTLVSELPNDGDKEIIFGTVTPDSKYVGLSRQTKDNSIDEDTGLFKPGALEPLNTHFNTDSYWTGMSKRDTLIVDLGGQYDIAKISLVLPWWGGATINSNRAYDFTLDYAPELTSGEITYRGRIFHDTGTWANIYNSGNNNQLAFYATGTYFYLGTGFNDIGREDAIFNVKQDVEGPVPMRYIRTAIRNVHAWYGNTLEGIPIQDGYDYECDPGYDPGDFALVSPTKEGVMKGLTISDRVVEPQNDCHAGVVEIAAYQQIMPVDTILPLVLQRIDNNNLQITYHHVPQSTDTVTTDDGFRKFEPGGFFRKFHVTYTGANTSFTKFYSSDCTNCFPDGFNFGIMDQNNSLIYATDTTSGTDVFVRSPARTNLIHMKGANDAHVSYVDSWPSVSDPLSWGGSYSFTEMANDYATIHFKGQSFKWYATIPEDKTGATVKIEIRSKTGLANFGAWSTLVNSMVLDSNITNQVVYDISYESGILVDDTVYEIKISNLDGGYASIDSIEGFWAGSMTDYNEDSHRLVIRELEKVTQIYDQQFSGGSMYKSNKRSQYGFRFTGDRIVFYSAKGHNHGIMRIALVDTSDATNNKFGNTNSRIIPIPGSDSLGYLHINLNTGKRGNEIPQYIAFDSNDYFPDGLPWKSYNLAIYLAAEDLDTFTTTDVSETDSFVQRCKDCNPPTGDTVSVNKPIFIDGFSVHERVGLSVQFENDTHLDILKSVVEAAQVEWDITEDGLRVEPRIGRDTNEVLREGQNTLVQFNIVNDITQIASMLVSTGADIDGLPLFTITEDKSTREDLGRTVMRKEDFRDTSDYFQLVGLSRNSLRKRKKPEKRIQVTHTAKSLNLKHGDSYILYTRKMGPIRVRINKKTIVESSSAGTTFNLECVRWPQIM